MKLRAYSIYDRKGLIYNTPYFSHTDATAVRSFTDLVNDRNASISAHPDDYVLFAVGEYDDQTGQLVPFQPVQHICDALPLVHVAKQQMPLFAGPADRQAAVANGEDR